MFIGQPKLGRISNKKKHWSDHTVTYRKNTKQIQDKPTDEIAEEICENLFFHMWK